ncbi:MAG: competence protein competence protein ComFC [Candidatus Parcubacteria bacterium]|nr:competence protein competence protein ComFC [Candidatus Parcubacteria bacterium]
MGASSSFRNLLRAPRCSIPEACSVFAYGDERVSKLVWSIKYKKSREGAAIAGHALHQVARLFSRAVPEGMRVLIVPMPITKVRRRQRGFNQCELILDEMRRLDIERRLLYANDLILRVRHTSRQTTKDRTERLEGVKDLFAMNETALAKLTEQKLPCDRSSYFVVIIDDVITTGSTMRAAIETLRRAGFTYTYGLSVAH